MMKPAILLIIVLFVSRCAVSQANLPEFNREQAQINKAGFVVLGSWSTASIITGAIGMGTTQGQAKYFHQMNLIWGSVNILIAGSGWLGANRRSASLNYAQTLNRQVNAEKTFLFNAGLDLVYITAGGYLIQKAKNDSKSDKFNGYGKSFLVQGIGLLFFDAIMYNLHNSHGKKLYRMLEGLQVSSKSLSLNVSL